MEVSGDELAGVVDLFGGLTRTELEDAIAELAFKRGEEAPDGSAIESAIEAYTLVEFDRAGETVLVAGPAAFPTLPEGAADLPHILDVESRELDRSALGTAVEERFRGEAARAVAGSDHDRIAQLVDVSYDLEAWAPVDLATARDRLDAAEPTN